MFERDHLIVDQHGKGGEGRDERSCEGLKPAFKWQLTQAKSLPA
jgi:hypothetical protein